MIGILVFVFVLAIVGRFARGKLAPITPYLYALTLFSVFMYFATEIPSVGNPIFSRWQWSRHFGVDFSLILDGLSLTFALLISGIGAGVFLYAASYMKKYKKKMGFFSTLLVFTGAMLGLVLSDNLLLTFIFWECTSVTSYLLIAYHSQKVEARESARTALFVTVGGGLFFLIGIVLISLMGQQQGLTLGESLTISQLSAVNFSDHHFLLAALSCIALAVATKSAQFPFHFWLPLAMAGPTPVSSFLHSATMVKAGVFLLARLFPVFGNSEIWSLLFVPMGALTMLVGALLAASQRDIKKILAYSTMSVLGTLVMLLGLGTEMSIKAAVVYIVAHALYKASLFQIIGNVDFSVQNRDIKELKNLGRSMPITAIAAALSSLSMAGAPPLFGFFGKELAYMSKLDFGSIGVVLIAMAVLSNILIVGLALSICARPFWRFSQADLDSNVEKAVPTWMSVSPLLLAILGCFVGLFPGYFDQYLGTPMASSIYGSSLEMKLKLWHGFDPQSLLIVALSAITIAGGIFIFLRLSPVISFFSDKIERVAQFSITGLYNKSIDTILSFANKVTSYIQSGNLRWYLRLTFLSVATLLFFPYYKLAINKSLTFAYDSVEVLFAFFIGVPILATLFLSTWLVKIALISVSGLSLVLAFSLFSAVDLGMTQLMVESLSIVFIFFLLHSRLSRSPAIPIKLIDYGISIFLSFLIAGLLLFEKSKLPTIVSQYFIDNAYIKAYGKNIVNVILVDFRALDTLGEVIAVAIAAIGVGILLAKNFQRVGK